MPTVLALLLVVRVFDLSGESAAARAAAMRAASAILRQADIATSWTDCSPDSPSASRHPCASPLAPTELALRITPAPRTDRPGGARSLGYSMVDPEAGGGTLGTVFSDRIAWLADASRCRRTTLLGRAIAHEVGHLLIGTNEHSSTGLMRAVWTAHDLVRNRREDWLFAPDDRTRLHNSRRVDRDALRVADGANDTSGNGES